jgi:hypothetical protein
MSEMPQPTTIQGDVSGQIAVGSYINQFKDLNGCNITILPADDRPSLKRHGQPTNIKPRPPGLFLDRTIEVERIKNAVRHDQPMTLSGATGVGKTTLLKQLAQLTLTDLYQDGIYFLPAYNLKLDDLLQCLFSAFYESSIAIKPDRAQIQIALQEIRALVLIDDLMLTRDEIQIVLDIAPKCGFVISSNLQGFQSESETILLSGLPDQEALILFEKNFGRELIGDEKQLVSEICHLLQGNPANIGWVAAKIYKEAVTLESTISNLKEKSPEFLFIESVQSLPQIEKQILEILAVVDGGKIPHEHFLALLQSEATNQALEDLIVRSLVQSHSPVYSLNESFASELAKSGSLAPWEEALAQYFVTWLTQKPDRNLVMEIQDTLLILLKKVAERKNWPLVISLGRALEPVLISEGYWQAWNEILQFVLNAARALGDRKVEAWTLHQLGSQALCLGAKEQAGNLLSQAASIRRSIGDLAGLELTQHNLSILTGAFPAGDTAKPFSPSPTLPSSMILAGSAILVGLAALAGLFFYRPAPPALLQPQNEFIETTSTNPYFQWQEVWSGATYQIQVDNQQDFSSLEYEFITASTEETLQTSLEQGIYYWRVRAISRFNRFGNWSETRQITISIPPGIAALSQPADQAIETNLEALFFAWDGVENTAYYVIQIDDNEDFSSAEYENQVSDNNLSSIALAQGEYYWHVQAFNQYDTPGEWSEPWKFIISIPPVPPTLISLPNESIEDRTDTPSFEWSGVDNAVTYQIQVDDDPDFNSPDYATTEDNTARTIDVALAQGEYYWRVQALNIYDTPGEWSETWKFIISIPPVPPTLISPANELMEDTTVTPSFEWSGVDNAVTYQIQVDDDPDFNSPDYATTEDNTARTIDIALAQGEYYWHVQAFNQYDTPGEWSEPWKFIISIAPVPPTLISLTNESIEDQTVTPSFEWSGVDNAVRYQIQVDDNPDFNSPEYVTAEEDTGRTIDTALAQGIHYWRVQAFNQYDTPGDWSETWSFTISIPPGTPNLLEPSNSQYISANNPTFKWQSTANTHSYELQVDNNSNFSSPVYDSSTFFSSETPPGFAQGRYYWHVRAFNIYGTAGEWSTRRQFTISIPPGVPTLYSPANFATLYVQPTFSWSSVSNASGYQIQIFIRVNNSLFLDSTTTSTQFISPTYIPEDYYFWRIRAYNQYGTPGPWSSIWFFHTIEPIH